MRQKRRMRLWLQVGLASASTFLLILTAFAPAWIETVFGVDPDHHSGALEWAIVALLLLAAVASGVLAAVEWRRPRPDVRTAPLSSSEPR